MNHFPIVQALCRAAMAQPTPALRKQVERLRDALAREGKQKQAASLASVLSAADRMKDIAPSRIIRSKVGPLGEAIHRSTQVPVDKETAAPLAEIIFPEDINMVAPLFNPTVAQATKSIVGEWQNCEMLLTVDIRPSNTCLIYGDPGTGKTRLALWIARELMLPVVLIRLDGLVSSFLGTTARNIGNLFTFANRYQCILLLDEFDAIAKLRDDPQEVGEIKRVVNTLLQNLDGRKDIGLTIGITNHPALLDPAVWRRFEIQLDIPRPDFQVREAIAKHFMPPVQAPDAHIRLISWFAEGSTGAEIEALVRTYKKARAIQKGDPHGLLETLRQFAALNAARIQPDRRELLFAKPEKLFRVMYNDKTLNFTLADIGEIAGRDKSTVSRLIGKPRDRAKKKEAIGG
ncbi:MAG: AAA family ATPase [Rhodobacteraceae bacterium]|nr:AAA family ATPase [Paracoccaceae bacterium]MCY4197094.1 AAA family ATPase [Paracoccaceae bacterium]MCY4328204.1 AAA family ATPase [Paracoccaceae bacterium]